MAFPPGISGVLSINLSALRRNYRAMAALAPGATIAGVVKANGYGLGAEAVALALSREGCRQFFVAHLDEAIALKTCLPPDATIFVLNGLQPGSEGAAAAGGIVPVINSVGQLARWAQVATASGRILPAALQIDTGMARLGLAPDDLDGLELPPQVDIGLVLSHLASADEPGNGQSEAQLAVFERVTARFAGIPVSLANSAGALRHARFHKTVIRAGIALYGMAPSERVVGLDIAVIQTRAVPAGTAIGYGGSFVAPQAMRLATLAAGYADGLPRALSNCGAVFFEGERLPIVGRVSMDSVMVDIGRLGPGALVEGSLVQLIGPDQSLEAVALAANTIPYEILTRLGSRYHRVLL